MPAACRRTIASGRVLLMADDEPITRMLVKLLLERQNFEVLEASNGRQAVDIATRERPDLMVDLNMPETQVTKRSRCCAATSRPRRCRSWL